MFKLLVLSAVLAVAVAKPDVLLSAPAAYAAPLASPVAGTYLHSGSYLASPAVYPDIAYSHWIKKRAAQLFDTYVAPSTYIGSPLVAPVPINYASSVLPTYVAPAHLIKKRSAQLLDVASPWHSTYLASDPLVSSAVIPSASYYSTYPGYATGWPFIKK